MPTFAEQNVATIRPNPWIRLLYGVPILTALALVIGIIVAVSGGVTPTQAGRDDFGGFMSTMMMFTLLTTGAVSFAIARNVAARRVTAPSITANLDGVRADEKTFIPRDKIKNAYLVDMPDGQCRVRLVGKHLVPLLDVILPTRERGTEILRALELDVLHRVLESPAILLGPGLRMRTTFLVGADGVVIRGGGIGFIPYSDIESVAIDTGGGVLRRRSGGEIRYIGYGLTPGAITERIREGLDAYRRAEAPANAAAIVGRSGRPAREWLTALRALSAPNEGDYRAMAVPDDALWTIAEDHGAEPTARAGAAVVLRERLGEPGRVRLEATAAATAEPKIRIALEAAAKGEEEALEEALGQWESEERQRA